MKCIYSDNIDIENMFDVILFQTYASCCFSSTLGMYF
jgi:hypothetical protein